ncbi:hypothetical protein QO004_002767 [Rhizobium mesoamericanum]|nr:hypothetical protein [Rhizobium mesoamericanum]
MILKAIHPLLSCLKGLKPSRIQHLFQPHRRRSWQFQYNGTHVRQRHGYRRCQVIQAISKCFQFPGGRRALSCEAEKSAVCWIRNERHNVVQKRSPLLNPSVHLNQMPIIHAGIITEFIFVRMPRSAIISRLSVCGLCNISAASLPVRVLRWAGCHANSIMWSLNTSILCEHDGLFSNICAKSDGCQAD